MKFENKLNQCFDNLPRRILYCYKFCMSEPNYVDSDVASKDSQLLLHQLFLEIIDCLYDDPQALNLHIEKDDSYEIYVSNNRKPDLILSIRKIREQINELYSLLYLIGFYGDISDSGITVIDFSKSIKIKKKYISYFMTNIQFIGKLGVDIVLDAKNDTLHVTSQKYQAALSALKLLANREPEKDRIDESIMFDFICCVFDKQFDYLLHRIEYCMGLDSKFFTDLFAYFSQKGYEYEFKHGFGADGISFSFEYKSKVSGLSISLDVRKIHQIIFSLSSEIGSKYAIEHYMELPIAAQDFIDSQIRSCTQCLSCTKGGKKIATVNTIRNGKEITLCPPSIWIGKNNIEQMSRSFMEGMCTFIEMQDKYAK